VAPSYSLVRKPCEGVFTHYAEQAVAAELNDQRECKCCQKQNQHDFNRNEYHWISAALHNDRYDGTGIVPTALFNIGFDPAP